VKRKIRHRRRLIVAGIGLCVLLSGATLYWRLSVVALKLPLPPLKDMAAKHNVDLGIHVKLVRLADEPYAQIAGSQYASLIIDGEAHWGPLRPSETDYDYTQVDEMMAFAQANNQAVETHHLLWGEHTWLPGWLKRGDYTKEQLLELIHEHITQVVGRYKGRVAAWTVVNETFTRAEYRYGLKDWWADHLGGGTDYIDQAFRWAHAADPDARLILNDFENETEGRFSNAMYDYIKGAQARGVPIHGIGMQMHVSGANPPDKQAVIKNMQRFAELGVKSYVTEFDVNVNSVKGDHAHKRKVEAQVTYDMVRACIESKVCARFAGFGISDKQDTLKWLMRTDSHSFPFDSRYRPKPSFHAFYKAWQEP
jgi:endo-1,4-beta-xylanase